MNRLPQCRSSLVSSCHVLLRDANAHGSAGLPGDLVARRSRLRSRGPLLSLVTALPLTQTSRRPPAGDPTRPAPPGPAMTASFSHLDAPRPPHRAARRAAAHRAALRPQPQPRRPAPRDRRVAPAVGGPPGRRRPHRRVAHLLARGVADRLARPRRRGRGVRRRVRLGRRADLGARRRADTPARLGSPHGVGEATAAPSGATTCTTCVGAGPGRSLTVHAYAPGLVTMGEFELAAEGPGPARDEPQRAERAVTAR